VYFAVRLRTAARRAGRIVEIRDVKILSDSKVA
jgi:hypothetical protein